jgi:hypothetical protein
MSRLQLIILATVIGLTIPLVAQEPKEIRIARKDYEALQHPTEADRIRYVTRLVRLRESYTRADDKIMEAIDTEIIRHPMLSTANSRTLAKLLIGQWQSPRHSYFYHADGTWASDDDITVATSFTWRIDHNKFFQNYAGETPDPGQTIILLTSTDFVYGIHIAPYYLRRGTAFPWH